jgi:hypothetical protein
LLKKFTKIPTLTNAVVDPEVSFYCAFNFPGLLKLENDYFFSSG